MGAHFVVFNRPFGELQATKLLRAWRFVWCPPTRDAGTGRARGLRCCLPGGERAARREKNKGGGPSNTVLHTPSMYRVQGSIRTQKNTLSAAVSVVRAGRQAGLAAPPHTQIPSPPRQQAKTHRAQKKRTWPTPVRRKGRLAACAHEQGFAFAVVSLGGRPAVADMAHQWPTGVLLGDGTG
jgi:hypothetical protein